MTTEFERAPSWSEISLVADFVIRRHGEQIAQIAQSLDDGQLSTELIDLLDRQVGLVRLVNRLRAAPLAKFNSPGGLAHVVADDSLTRKINYAALIAMAQEYSDHDDWDKAWQ